MYLFLVSVITEEKVISLPVPDVVGIVMKRGSGFVAAVLPSYFLISVSLWASKTPTDFAQSIGLPPPTAIIQSQSFSLAIFAPSSTLTSLGLASTPS